MVFPKKEVVAAVRARYPAGTRVALVSLIDPYSRLKPGDRGRLVMWMIPGRYLWIGIVVPGLAWFMARIGYGFWKAVIFYDRDFL